MRRRRIFNLLAATSLLLCVGTGILWITAEVSGRFVAFQLTDSITFGASGNFFYLQRTRAAAFPPGTGVYWDRELLNGAIRAVEDFEIHRFGRINSGVVLFQAGVNSLLVAAVFCIVPLAWASIWVRRVQLVRRRVSASLCPSCGYDLRATPERCSECGASAVV